MISILTSVECSQIDTYLGILREIFQISRMTFDDHSTGDGPNFILLFIPKDGCAWLCVSIKNP